MFQPLPFGLPWSLPPHEPSAGKTTAAAAAAGPGSAPMACEPPGGDSHSLPVRSAAKLGLKVPRNPTAAPAGRAGEAAGPRCAAVWDCRADAHYRRIGRLPRATGIDGTTRPVISGLQTQLIAAAAGHVSSRRGRRSSVRRQSRRGERCRTSRRAEASDRAEQTPNNVHVSSAVIARLNGRTRVQRRGTRADRRVGAVVGRRVVDAHQVNVACEIAEDCGVSECDVCDW